MVLSSEKIAVTVLHDDGRIITICWAVLTQCQSVTLQLKWLQSSLRFITEEPHGSMENMQVPVIAPY